MSRAALPLRAVSSLFLERQHLARPRSRPLTPSRLVRFAEDVGGVQSAQPTEQKLGEDFLDGTYYCTDQTHASNTKAAANARNSRSRVRRQKRRKNAAATKNPSVTAPAKKSTSIALTQPPK